ncbi:tyrosine-type recombinase/integrase, partial [Dysgonomonas sp. ZJ709]|uniref:tyrosine-type recombinase/integrase n=1 Tax=Dysgonomonas sp. ZJ709 TaxID=2709797 RepID=UPI0013E9CAA3
GLVDIQIPKVPKQSPRKYIPHVFTKEELVNFFNACDTITTRTGFNGNLRRITIPVFFRLLYSSGMRTTEVRLLRAKDIDLENGVINIRFSKGLNQHFTVLHDSMFELMKVYDSVISKLIPNRVYFFPMNASKGFSDQWIRYFFRKLWYQNNNTYATAYELRHHYAVENINKWIGQGLHTHMRLLSLSKSMGHSNVENTKYYYSLVPGLSDILENTSQETFNEIIPKITDNEKSSQ